MRVSIIKSLQIKNLILPEKIDGSYWIDDIDENGIKENLISIEADNGKWKLTSNKEVYSFNKDKANSFVYLENENFYYVRNDTSKETFMLYCSPALTDYIPYDINNLLDTGIKIGSDQKNYVVYPIIDSEACYIKKIDNIIYINDNQSKCGIYVNNIRVAGKKELKVGDIVFIAGLKIVLSIINSQEHKYCIYINNGNLKNIDVKSLPIEQMVPINNPYNESEQELDFPLYEEKEYFHKTPRFVQKDEPLVIQIDPPPTKEEDKDNSLLLTVGPMLTMSMTSMVTGYTAVNSVLSGTATWARATPSLVICGAMFASVFIWPMFSKSYQKKARIENEKIRQEKYSQYIESKRKKIIEAKANQISTLQNNYMKISEASDTINRKYTRLWQRRTEDKDFLDVNLGSGSYPMQIDIKYPEDKFSMVEDNLKEMVLKLGQEPKMLSGVPVIFSFKKNFISGIIGNSEINEYTRRLIIQLLALHSYDDLKIIVLTDEEKAYQWKFLKQVPHCFSDNKGIRFFASNNDEYKEVCYYLDKVFHSRNEKINGMDRTEENYKQNYLIITDCFKKVRDFDIIQEILDNKKYFGFSLVMLDYKITNLPDQCSSFITLTKDKGELRNNDNINSTIEFSADFSSPIDYDECSKSLANIPIELHGNEENQIVNKLGFLEMYDVGKVEQLNSLTRWHNNNPILNLQVPVGVGKNGEKICIDLHEKYHGPHGLIAGMTGSGKSEFIITYILSMAVNYHPYEVQFILIDYKGGGLAGAFENKNTGVKLPHLVGTITNLDSNEIKRSLASIESELKRRQALFNKAREISGESTIDIYKYQQMFRDCVVDEPVSHLFIISDEFAELKNQQPEFMAQLISTARIGRSLGVHLILATQKPSGVVDPQIWSNTRFRVCMRVQDKSDSNEVIKCPDAAYLKQTGRFYFQVGFNEIFELGQAAYAGGKYIPAEKVTKSLDTSIDFINNIGYTIKKVDTKKKSDVSFADVGEELTNLVKYLDTIAQNENIKCKPLWLDKIPEDIRIDKLASKYNYQKENYIINPIIGEFDIPSNQEQKLLTLPLSKNGNALVYGASGSGKENFISTMIYSSMMYYSPEEINYYIIDFGSESLKMFNDYPIVGNVLLSDDEEKICNLFKMLNATIEERKVLFTDYNGDYLNYCKNSGNTVPSIVVVVNNYESYQETYNKFDDTLVGISRECIKYGIYFVLAVNTPNGVRFKLRQNFSLIYSLQQNNDEDYTTILGNVHKNFPARIFGRGMFKNEDVFEFQTALICEKENIIKYVKEQRNNFIQKYETKAKPIPVLPEVVDYNLINNVETNELVIGLDKSDLSVSTFDFNKSYTTIITAQDLSICSNFVNPFINQIIKKNETSLIVINADDFNVDTNNISKYNYVNQQFNEIFDSLNKFLVEQYQIYVENNYDKSVFNDKKKIDCIIIGIDSFKNKLNSDNKAKFADLFNDGKELGIINYVIVDSIDKIKKVEIESWYKNSVNNNYGIWIGNGINDQFSLKFTQKMEEMKENVPDSFCFVIKRGKPQFVKYIEILNLDNE